MSGAVMTPIVLSSTFAQDGPGNTRATTTRARGNPTRDGARGVPRGPRGRPTHAIAFASGCAATTAVLMTLRAGDHVLVGDDVYGGTFRIFDKVLAPFGLEATFVDMTRPGDRVRRASRPDDPTGLAGDPEQPDAQGLRHRGDRRGRASARGVPAGGRQHVRDAAASAAARPRRHVRRSLDDEVLERALGRRGRRRHDERRRRWPSGSTSSRRRSARSRARSTATSSCAA